MGLLLLRAAIGAAVILQGILYFIEPTTTGLTAWMVAALAIGSGVLTFIGFLTPLAGVLAAICTAGIALSLFPSCTVNLFDAKLPAIFGVIMLAAVVLLGPGAFSVDARLFGRREIIIPATRSPR